MRSIAYESPRRSDRLRSAGFRPSSAMTWTTGCAYWPTLISGDAARRTTWSGGTCSIKLTSPRLRALDRGLALRQPDFANALDRRSLGQRRLAPTLRGRAPSGFAPKPARRRASPGRPCSGLSCRRRSRRSQRRRAAAARRDRLAATMHTVQAISDQGAIGLRGAPGRRYRHGPGRPARATRAALERRVVEPELEPRLVGDVDPVEQVGPAGFVPERMRIGAVDQVAPHVDRRDRPRAVGPEKAGPDLDDQPTAQVGRFDRRGELAGLFPCGRRRRRWPGSGDRAAG